MNEAVALSTVYVWGFMGELLSINPEAANVPFQAGNLWRDRLKLQAPQDEME